MRRLPNALIALGLALAVGLPAITWAQVSGGLSVYQATLMELDQKTGEVSTDELRQLLADGSAVVYDSRPPMSYALGHIPGALNAPTGPGVAGHVAAIQQRVPAKDSAIVLYCNGVY